MDVSHVQKHCPKCGGNLFLYNDYNGWYEQCLQCSFILYLDMVYKDGKRVDSGNTSETNKSRVSKA